MALRQSPKSDLGHTYRSKDRLREILRRSENPRVDFCQVGSLSCRRRNTQSGVDRSAISETNRCNKALKYPWHTIAVTKANTPKDSNGPAPSITTVSSREIYRNPWMRLREDEILRSNGKTGIYGVVEKDEAAIILPIDGDHIWLVEQFRYTIQERAMELPQGGWEMEVEFPEKLARGELKEETGLHAAEMTCLASLWIAYGFTRQKQHVFLATGLTQSETDPDEEEHDMVVRRVPIIEFEQMMLDGVIGDASTVAAWGFYLMWKARH
jgi:ADP-ribose pyrophosphatase